MFAGGRADQAHDARDERRAATILRHPRRVDARQKSRVLIARARTTDATRRRAAPSTRPRACLHRSPSPRSAGPSPARASTSAHDSCSSSSPPPLRRRRGSGDAIDLACGTGVVATWLALRSPALSVIASDRSASGGRGLGALHGRCERRRRTGCGFPRPRPRVPVRRECTPGALNPPFHAGTAVPMSGVADPLFAEAGRVLARGGELWAVWNSSPSVPSGPRAPGRADPSGGPRREVHRVHGLHAPLSTSSTHRGTTSVARPKCASSNGTAASVGSRFSSTVRAPKAAARAT